MNRKIDKTLIEKHLRRLPYDKLRLLRFFTGPEKFVSSATIAGATKKDFVKLGGTVSSLVRTKIEGEQLIKPVGKSQRQAILELNQKVTTSQTLKEILDEIGIK